MSKEQLIKELFNFRGKTALITGGGTGLGRIVTETLSKFGANVIIVSRKENNIVKMTNELLSTKPDGFVQGITADLSQEHEIIKLVSRVKDVTGSIEILVNNSGVSWGAELGSFPYSAWSKVLSVNVTGLFHLTQSLIPLIKRNASVENPSKIVNIGSVMGLSPYGDGAYSYAASKSAVHHLTRILAKELAKERITVNAFAPGPFESKMTQFAMNSDQQRESIANSVPLGRIGNYNDIVAATLLVCGSGGNYMTGAIIPIDGGLHVTTGPEIFEESKSLLSN